MRNRWIWAAALAVAGSSVMWFLATAGPAVEPPIWSEPLPGSVGSQAAVELVGEPGPVAGPARMADGLQWHLRVLDGAGRPARGAWLFADSDARAFSPGDALAVADASGHVVVRDDWLGNSGLLVAARGHRSRSVGLEGRDPDRLHVVQLVAGAAVTIDVRSVDGGPVAGIPFVLSRAAIDGRVPTSDDPTVQDLVPGGDPLQALHVATTDQHGRLRCAGLSPGPYEIRPADPMWMVLGDRPLIAAPGYRTVEVGQLHGVAVDFGDEVLTQSLSYRLNPIAINQYRASINRAEEVLRERFPTAVCRAAWVHPSVHAQGGDAALSVFCRHAGWRSVQVPLRPVSEIREPLVVDVERAGDQTSLVNVVYEQEDGKPIDRPLVLVYTGEQSAFRGMRKTVWPGEQRLPAGTWNAMPVDGYLMQALGPRPMVTFEPGGNAELRVTVPGRYRMARIAIEGGGHGVADDYASLVLLDAREERVQVLPYVPLARRLVPLPIGRPSTLLVSRRGYRQERIDLSPEPASEELVVSVALETAPFQLASR